MNKNITKFPKGFFQIKRPTITASEALADVEPLKWKDTNKSKKKSVPKLTRKKK